MHKYLEPHFDKNNNISPEARLAPAILGACLIPVYILVRLERTAGNPLDHAYHRPQFLSSGCFSSVEPHSELSPNAYPACSASVLGANDLFQLGFGAGFPLLATVMYQKVGVGWASSTLAFLPIAFILILFVFIRVSLCLYFPEYILTWVGWGHAEEEV